MNQAEFKDDANMEQVRPKQAPTTLNQPQQLNQQQQRFPRPQSSQSSHDLDQALCLLAKTKISERRPRASTGSVDVTKEGSTIVANSTDSLTKIMEICSIECILGMGVIDGNNRCVGIIDIPNICTYLFQHCLKDVNKDTLTTTLTSEMCSRIQNTMSTTTVMDVVRWLDKNHCCPLTRNAGKRNCDMNDNQIDKCDPHVNPFCSSMVIPDGHSLLFAMEMLCHSGVKRVVTVDNEQKVTGFYSTSMCISDIRQQAHLLRSFTQCSVQQCLDLCQRECTTMGGLTNQQQMGDVVNDTATATTTTTQNDTNMDTQSCVTSLPITATAFEAFQLMIQQNITGIALMDAQNKLTGTISIRDLRGLGKTFEHLDRLRLPLKDFKTITLKEYPQIAPSTHWSDAKTPAGCRYVELERGTMRDVLLALNDGNLNRVMIMNEDGKLCGIITLHDVIRCLLVCLGVLEE